MHVIKNQYLKHYYKLKYNFIMHDLKAIYEKVRTSIKSTAKEYFEYGENYRFYSNPPKMSDLEIISLSIAAECLGIDSENLLWSKIEKDYPNLFQNLIHRTSFNRRRKNLSVLLHQCMDSLSDCIDEYMPSVNLIIDSMPIPTCSIVREKSSRACRRPELDEICAAKNFNPIFKNYYIGYKLHLICNEYGVYRDFMITPANVHDNYYLKLIDENDVHLHGHNLLGDRAYIGKSTQLEIFESYGINLDIPYRRNQKDYKRYAQIKKIKRKTIEVVFSQFCDEFMARRNYAKRYKGLDTRVKTKIAAKTFKQFWNMKHGKPINQTKHSLVA